MLGLRRTSVTGGNGNSFFLDDNDNVWACGTNNFSDTHDETVSQFTKLENLENICSVDSGYSHTLFLDQDGKVYSCGTCNEYETLGRDSDFTQPSIIPGLPKITSIAASFNKHSLFLDEESHVWACGDNYKGQLGLGVTSSHQGLTKLELPPMKSVTAGWMHSVFLDEDGTPWTCGNNSQGELGLGTMENRCKAEKIANLPSIKEIFAGCQHTMFLGEDGSVWGTGFNGNGELGYSEKPRPYLAIPKKIEGLPEIKMIALGWNHSLFLDFSGGVWACGDNSSSQLGTKSSAKPGRLPIELKKKLPELPEMQMIAAGSDHSLFVDVENSLWACGSNQHNQLGVDYKTEGKFAAPKVVANAPKVKLNNKYRNVKSARKVI